MKTSKKTGLFLSIILSLLLGLLFVSHPKASAATSLTKAQLDAANYVVVKDSDSSFHVNLATNGDAYSFYDSNIFSGPLNFKFKGGTPFCGATIYGSNDSSKGITITDSNLSKGSVDLNYIDSSGKCVSYTNPNISFVAASGSGTAQQGQGCISGADCQNGVCAKTGGDCVAGQGVSQCEQNGSGWALTWLACPVLEAASGLSDKLLGIFEDQLAFSVDQLGNESNVTSGAFKVHQSWAIIRDISSGLLVIVLLVMIFSQAVSFGPFDAYTIRKLLPRLIAAVILIQISWTGVSWVVDLVNAIARGIADIMFFPFGGSANLDLWHLLANAKLSDGTLTTLNWAALALGVVLGVAFLFTMLGVAFVALMALLFAVITLIFRKILIITLLMFAPLALLAWILPGTERYWKMWKDNLIKVLAMFPIVVAIIAAGRIFAYVVGTQDNSQLLNLIFILVGFFGPLFILPKTFKWGGQAMQLAGNGIMKLGDRVSAKPKDFLNHRQQEYSAFRQAKSAQRVYKDPKQRGSVLRLDPFRSGKWDPTLRMGTGREERRNEQIARYVERGKKAQGEEVAAFSTLVGAEVENMNRRDALDHLMKRFESTEGAERWAVMQKVAQLQDGSGLTQMRDQLASEDGGVLFWNNFVNGNYDSLKGISPHLANGVPQEATIDVAGVPTPVDFKNDAQRQTYFAALDAGRFTGMKDEELAVMSDDGWKHFGNVNAGQARLRAQRISANETQRGRMAPTALGLAGITGGTPTNIAREETSRTIEQSLPDPATLVAGGPVREALKVQLRTDENARRSLARGLAYDTAHPIFREVLAEARNDAVAAGTPEARQQYNAIVNEIQNAYQQRINETTSSVAGRGRDPLTARAAASGRLAPEIANLEPTAPAPPLGTPDLRKLF